MRVDAVMSRELKSMQEELSTTHRARLAARAASAAATKVTEAPKEIPEERELFDQLRELASEATGYFDEAEKAISAHPTQSVVGALLVGILIGRMLGRR
jgi:ElaB/YqjD/DUF883 family membrane-anchored ribosome-binding protein